MPIRTGLDVTDNERIVRILEDHGDHFKTRFFPHFERKKGDTDNIPPQKYAGLWSAKEAVFKALGRGFRWREVFIDHESSGRPLVKILDDRLEFKSLAVPHYAEWDCSITHDADIAIAFAACYWNQ